MLASPELHRKSRWFTSCSECRTFDFLGELDALRVCQRLLLLLDAFKVQHLAHELDDRLSLVERSGRH